MNTMHGLDMPYNHPLLQVSRNFNLLVAIRVSFGNTCLLYLVWVSLEEVPRRSKRYEEAYASSNGSPFSVSEPGWISSILCWPFHDSGKCVLNDEWLCRCSDSDTFNGLP
jgi:hypothetical protein